MANYFQETPIKECLVYIPSPEKHREAPSFSYGEERRVVQFKHLKHIISCAIL